MLAGYTLEKLAIEHGLPLKRISPAAMNLLLAYDWPGNVRELANVLERAVVLNGDETIDVSALSELAEAVLTLATPRRVDIQTSDASVTNFHRHGVENRCLTLEEMERKHLQFVLDDHDHNISAAARTLGIDRRNLIRKIEKYELVVHPRRGRPAKKPR